METYIGDEITLAVPQGIGDIFWIYQKFSPYFNKINFKVLITSQDVIQNRSQDFLPLFPKVNNVSFQLVDPQEYQIAITFKSPSIAQIINEHKAGKREFLYACNLPLEHGVRIEEIDPDYPLEETVPVITHYCTLPFNEYIVLYVCGTNKNPDVWTPDQWVQLVQMYYAKYDLKYPIITLGAIFDGAVTMEIDDKLGKLGFKTYCAVQPYPGNACYLIKHAIMFIGYQSGLSILADNFDVPQLMIYFPILDKMRYAWAKKKNIKDGIYNTALFNQTPEDVVKYLNYNPNERVHLP